MAPNFQKLNTFSETTDMYQKVFKIKCFSYALEPTRLVVWGLLPVIQTSTSETLMSIRNIWGSC